MLLDTTFLIDLLRGKDPAAYARLQKLERNQEIKGIAAVSVMELWKGAVQSNRPEQEKQKVDDLLSSLYPYHFDEQEAKRAGEIDAELLQKGEMIQVEDVIIAAVAITHHETILTRNAKHFQRIAGLKVETY